MTLRQRSLILVAALLLAGMLAVHEANAATHSGWRGATIEAPEDGGTGTELLFGAAVEPDVDVDGIGDESQDPDGGGLGADWQDDWFDDFAEGDELMRNAPLIVLMRSARL
jgi:hypothetical protein